MYLEIHNQVCRSRLLVQVVEKRASWWLSGKEFAYNAGGTGDRFNPWVRKIPWRRAWQPTPVFLHGEFHKQKSLVGYSP